MQSTKDKIYNELALRRVHCATKCAVQAHLYEITSEVLHNNYLDRLQHVITEELSSALR